MYKKIKILFCAEDFGSVEQNLYLIKFLNEKKLLDKKNSIFICNRLFKNKIENSHIYQNFYLSNICKKKEKKIALLSKKNNIDLAIVGMSIRPQSLDYKITEIMNNKNISTLAIQDFWGYTGNFNSNVYPKYLLVADKYAKKLTEKKMNSKIIISGLPKYLNKKPIYNFINKSDYNLLIIGQPYFIPGIKLYYKFLNNFNFKKFKNIFYIPHPLENNLHLFLKQKKFQIINRNYLNKILSKNFVIFSSFSTLCYDIFFSANFFKKKSSFKIIFLTFEKKTLKFLKKTIGDEKLPLVNNKNIFQLSNFKNSAIKIEKILEKKIISKKLAKSYFLKFHSKKFFLKIFKKLISKNLRG